MELERGKRALKLYFDSLVEDYKNEKYGKDNYFGQILGTKGSCIVLFGVDDDLTKYMQDIVNSLMKS